MLIDKDLLSYALSRVLAQRVEQGCALDVDSFSRRIEAAASSYDALYELALELRDPPLRPDWPHVEPLDWVGIVEESPRLNPDRDWPAPDFARAGDNVRAGFLGSVCGCVLGKPVEVDPSLDELRQAGESLGEWPLQDYISVDFLESLGRRHDSWRQTTRGSITAVPADDDIHYTIIGMLLLERGGRAFTAEDIAAVWSQHIAPGWTWGPERTALLAGGLARHHLFTEGGLCATPDVLLLNPGDEMCGALIRADAYGYACPGNPDLAAWLAWKDASFTHIKTGVYGPMFVAALIALCHDAEASTPGNHRLEPARAACRRIPARSRLSVVLQDALETVTAAPDWESGYRALHRKYGRYTHCQVYQEIGTLLNTLKFAENVGHGIGIQVCQGNDTDSFGATAGSILGVLFGAGSMEARWLAPFGDSLQLALADFHEHSLHSLAERLGKLPELVYFA